MWPHSPVGQPSRSRRPDRACPGAPASAPAGKNSTGIDPPLLRISGHGRPHEDPRQGVDDALQTQSGWAFPKRMGPYDPTPEGGRSGLLSELGPGAPHKSATPPRQDKLKVGGPVAPRKSETGGTTAQVARSATDGPSGDKTSPEDARPRDGPLGRAPVSAVQPAFPYASSTRRTMWPPTGDHSSRRAASRVGLRIDLMDDVSALSEEDR